MPFLESSWETLRDWALIGYLLGSIPFGILVARAFGLGNLRKIGSGNIGATNVLRTGNRAAAALTLLLDGAKGAAAVLAARYFGAAEDAVQLAALAALLGHLFPVWLGFRGGKGVATFLGIFLALSWPVGAMLCAVWLVVASVGRYSSLAALFAVASLPIWLFVFKFGEGLLLAFLVTILVYIRHAGNIRRLRKGSEPKIGSGS